MTMPSTLMIVHYDPNKVGQVGVVCYSKNTFSEAGLCSRSRSESGLLTHGAVLPSTIRLIEYVPES